MVAENRYLMYAKHSIRILYVQQMGYLAIQIIPQCKDRSVRHPVLCDILQMPPQVRTMKPPQAMQANHPASAHVHI